MTVTRFYENIDGDGKNVVLEFDPPPPQDVPMPCLWPLSKGKEGEADPLSFADITDDPPPEVLAAGHDLCIVPTSVSVTAKASTEQVQNGCGD